MNKRKMGMGLIVISLAMLAPLRPVGAGECDAELEAIGAVSASYLYTAFTAIGAIADGFANKTYKADQVEAIMGEMSNLLKLFKEQMLQVKAAEVSAEDKKSIDQMVEVSELLKKEAEALSAYSKSDKSADAKKYQEARQAAWDKLKILLDIKE